MITMDDIQSPSLRLLSDEEGDRSDPSPDHLNTSLDIHFQALDASLGALKGTIVDQHKLSTVNLNLNSNRQNNRNTEESQETTPGRDLLNSLRCFDDEPLSPPSPEAHVKGDDLGLIFSEEATSSSTMDVPLITAEELGLPSTRRTTYPVQDDPLSNIPDHLPGDASTISTLSETESVFDRLYRGHRQKRPRPTTKATPKVTNRFAAGGTIPTTPPSSSSRRAKGGDDEGDPEKPFSVFHRLHRNEKRAEPLWKQPSPPRWPVRQPKDEGSRSVVKTKGLVATEKETHFDVKKKATTVPEPLSSSLSKELEELAQVGTELETLEQSLIQYAKEEDDDAKDFDDDFGLDTIPSTSQELKDLVSLFPEPERATATTSSPPSTPATKRLQWQRPLAAAPSPNNTTGFFSLDEASVGLTALNYDPQDGTAYEGSSPPSKDFAKRLDLLLTPISKRLEEEPSPEADNVDVSPVQTPTRIRSSAAIRLQCFWRYYKARQAVISMLLQTTLAEIVTENAEVASNSSLARKVQKEALVHVLSGLCRHSMLGDYLRLSEDTISLVWEQRVDVGLENSFGVQLLETVTVKLSAQARRAHLTDRWRVDTLARLLIKMVIFSLLTDYSSAKGASSVRVVHQGSGFFSSPRKKVDQKQYAAATIQRWIRKTSRRGSRNETKFIVDSRNDSSSWESSYPGPVAPHPVDLTTRRDITESSPISSSSLQISRRNEAARTIQLWYRSKMFKTALQESSSCESDFFIDLNLSGYGGSQSGEALGLQSLLRIQVPANSDNGMGLSTTGYTTHTALDQQIKSMAMNKIVHTYITTLRYRRQHIKAIMLQSAFRRFAALQRFTSSKRAAIILQRSFRRFHQRRLENESVKILQRSWKRRYYIERNKRQFSGSIITLQSVFRGYRCRMAFVDRRVASIRIQSSWRSYILRKHLAQKVGAAISIQAMARMARLKNKFETKVFATVVIQTAARATLQRQSYLQAKRCATTIQKHFRGYFSRIVYSYKVAYVLKIQSHWRRARCQATFRRCAQGCLDLQRLARGYLARSLVKRIRSSVLIQSLWRSWYQRGRFRRCLDAAVAIQSSYRMHQDRLVYKEAIQACIAIQTVARKHRARSSFICIRRAIRTLQQRFRYLVARQVVAELNAAAVMVQSQWRRHVLYSNFRAKQGACIIIQKVWRCYRCMTNFGRLKHAALIVQRYYRGHQARLLRTELIRNFEQHIFSTATTIQTAVRRIQARTKFIQYSKATILIQSSWRRTLAIGAYDFLRTSVIMIQAAIRGSILRSRYLKKRVAAVIVQRLSRGGIARARFKVLKASVELALLRNRSAVLIQWSWRGHRAYSEHMLWRRTSAALTIQRVFRGARWRAYIHLLHVSALRIQSAWMEYCLYKNVILPEAAVVIQSQWRVALARESFVSRRICSIIIQSAVRAYLHRSQYRDLLHSAILVQAHVRGESVRRMLMASNMAATFIQTAWRASTCRSNFSLMRICSVIIQSAMRRALTKIHMEYQVRASVLLQRCWRGHVERNRISPKLFERKMQKAQSAAMQIQNVWRAHRDRSWYLVTQLAALTIQRAIKQWLSEKDGKQLAAIRIQVVWKRFVEEQRFSSLRLAVVKIQSLGRCREQRSRFLTLVSSVIQIQRLWRGFHCRKILFRERASALMIQSRWRRRLHQPRFMDFACLPLHERFIMDRSARQIQVAFYLHMMQMITLDLQSSVVILLRSMRGQLSRPSVRLSLKQINGTLRSSTVMTASRIIKPTSIKVHETALAWNEAVELGQVTAATLIQSGARLMLVRHDILRSRGSRLFQDASPTVKVPSRQLLPRQDIEQVASAVVIQRLYRGWMRRRGAVTSAAAALVVQRTYRGYRVRRHYLSTLDSIVLLQALVRRYLVRCEYLSRAEAVPVLQRYIRGFQCRQEHAGFVAACIYLQSWIRMELAKLLVASMRNEHHQEVVVTPESELAEKLQAASMEAMAILLANNEPTDETFGPCLIRLADRVKAEMERTEHLADHQQQQQQQQQQQDTTSSAPDLAVEISTVVPSSHAAGIPTAKRSAADITPRLSNRTPSKPPPSDFESSTKKEEQATPPLLFGKDEEEFLSPIKTAAKGNADWNWTNDEW